MEKKDEINQKYFQAEILKQYLTQLVEQKKTVDQKMAENSITKQIIENFSEKDSDANMWTPIGSGIFMNSKMINSEKFLVDIGANVLINEDKEIALETLKRTQKEFEKFDSEIMAQINEYTSQIKKLEEDISHTSKDTK